MNGLRADGVALAQAVARHAAAGMPGCGLLVCPPFTLLTAVDEVLHGSGVALGGQDCHALPKGACTGEVSAEMLADCGCSHVIIGHSERRQTCGETDAQIRDKLLAARRAGLVAILCVGETRAERDAGRTSAVVQTQLDGSLPDSADSCVVAYEPVWAIGSGLTPTAENIRQMHGFIRQRLVARYGEAAVRTRILYGGSVKPGNAKELLAVENVDGALVGGASLDASEFLAIAGVYV